MKRLLFGLSMFAFVLSGAARGADKIKVVTTIPDLADMTRQIGGDLVDVTSLATGVEDIHAVPMKPSFAVLLNRADVVVLMGLEAEHAFLPALLEAARNPKILRDGPATSTARCTSRRSRCRPASTARSAISTRWGTRTSTSIRCSARRWRGRSPTGWRATIRSMRASSRRTSRPTWPSSTPRSPAGRRRPRRSRARSSSATTPT